MFSRLNVRTKLLVMLLPAALGVFGLAGLGMKSRVDDRSTAQTTRHASEVAVAASAYVHRVQLERTAAATVAAAPSPELESMLADQRTATDRAADALRATLTASGATLSTGTTAGDVASIRRGIDRLDAARAVESADAARAAYTDIIQAESAAIGRLELGAGAGSAGAASRRWLAAGIEAESNAAATAAGLFRPEAADSVEIGSQPDAIATADAVDRNAVAASAQELVARSAIFYDTYQDYAGAAGVDQFGDARMSSGAEATATAFAQLAGDDAATTFDAEAATWPGLVRARLAPVIEVETASFAQDIARFEAAADDADSAVVYFGAGAAASCLLVVMLAIGVSRQITTALRRLSDAAREISEEQVPMLVSSLKSGSGVQGIHFTEVDTGSSDEFADVGHALNDLGSAMVAVATEQQVSLRKGISDIFVNLARRNQTLLDRQIQFIDRLEANEQDPDQLENLFRLDHLATRMRRNAESLLVLASAEAPRRRSRDVELLDVIRVAIGEVEDFARISLVAVEDAVTAGGAAVDLAHLLAELMENGAQYSPPERTVDVVGRRAADGSYVITISDHGVGMTAERLDAANRLLASPPPVGLAMSRALGFVVAGTLANRHQIRVQLAASSSGGVTADVTLPAALLATPEPTEAGPTEAGRTEAGPTGTVPVRDELPVVIAPERDEVTVGWTATGEYVDPDLVVPVATISWSEERLPEAPAPSKLVDMLPEGPAFDAGLYSLLGDMPPPTGPPALPEPGAPASAEPSPPIPGLWAAPIMHPRSPTAVPAAVPPDMVGTPPPYEPPAFPNAPVAPAAPLGEAAPLPQRRPGGTAPVAPEPVVERSAPPQRPADEVRSVLSRYRSGLEHGRTAEPGAPEPVTNDPTQIDDPGTSPA